MTFPFSLKRTKIYKCKDNSDINLSDYVKFFSKELKKDIVNEFTIKKNEIIVESYGLSSRLPKKGKVTFKKHIDSSIEVSVELYLAHNFFVGLFIVLCCISIGYIDCKKAIILFLTSFSILIIFCYFFPLKNFSVALDAIHKKWES